MRFNVYASKISDASAKFLRKYSERLNTLAGIEMSGIIHMSYRDVKEDLPELISQGKLNEAILKVLRSKRSKLPYFSLFFVSNVKKLKFILWIQDQYKLISKLEMEYLSSPPEPKLVSAGIKDLDVLGDKNLIDALAGGDILRWNAVRDLPYEQIFDKQLKVTIERRIDKKARDQEKMRAKNKNR